MVLGLIFCVFRVLITVICPRNQSHSTRVSSFLMNQKTSLAE
jgi:hypothetical protein